MFNSFRLLLTGFPLLILVLAVVVPESFMDLIAVMGGWIVLVNVRKFALRYRSIRVPLYNLSSRSRNCRLISIAATRDSYRVSAFSGSNIRTIRPSICVSKIGTARTATPCRCSEKISTI